MKNRVRELRSDLGWSQAQIAIMAGVSRQTINAIETEKYHPSLPLAFKLAKLLSNNVEYVFLPDEDDRSLAKPKHGGS